MQDIYITNDYGFEQIEIDAIRDHFVFDLSHEDFELISFVDEKDYVEGDNQFLKLPTGKYVLFESQLMQKDAISQMD